MKSAFWTDSPGDTGGIMPTYAFARKYQPDIVGANPAATADYSNALIRLNGGAAAIPAFKADLARVTGRSDIDVWDNAVQIGGPIRKATGYEAACLLAPGLAAAAGAAAGVAAALIASRWTPIGLASIAEPDPGFDADWLILGPGWAIAVLLVAGGTAALVRSGLSASRARRSPRGSAVAAAANRAGLPVAAVVGAR